MKTDYGYLVDSVEDVYVFANYSVRLHVEPDVDVELTPYVVRKILENVRQIHAREGE